MTELSFADSLKIWFKFAIRLDGNTANIHETGKSPTFAVVVCEGLVDKISPLLEEGTEVELLRVIGLDAVVRDARAGVEIHTGVDVHEGGALRHVEDVRHSEFLQTHCILGHEPRKTAEKWGQKNTFI